MKRRISNLLSELKVITLILFLVACEKKPEKVIQYYKDSSIYSEGFFLDEKEQGKFKIFYPNGKINLIMNFKNGIRNGNYQEFYLNGNLMLEQNMKNDLIDGGFNMYFEDGSIKEIGKCVLGKREGEAIVYYPNGKIWEINYYTNDKMHGESLTYSPEGNLLIEAIYNDGNYINGIHYNYMKGDRKKAYGIRVGEIQKMFNEDSSLFFVKNLSNDSYIKIHSKDNVEVRGSINFLTKDDSLNFNIYYPGWENKIQ